MFRQDIDIIEDFSTEESTQEEDIQVIDESNTSDFKEFLKPLVIEILKEILEDI